MFNSLFPSWINLLLVSSYLVNKGAAIRCYICGGEAEESYPCSEFQKWDARYSKECDENSKSCRVSRGVKEKTIVSRSCETIKLDDCKIANAIEYCYCSKDLCNNIGPTDTNEDQEVDEDFLEDSMEGSGMKNVDHKSVTQDPHILEKNGSTKTTPIDQNKTVGSTVTTSDKKYSSNCSIIQSNFYLIGILSFLYYMRTSQY